MSQIVHVVFQGVPGAYSHLGVRELFNAHERVQATGLESFEACFEAVSAGRADFALLPMENTMGGTIADNHDLQLRHGLYAVAEINKRVEHALLALPGVKKSDLKFVASHPQALAQCAEYLRRELPQAEIKQEFDTAGSAQKIASGALREWGALASTLAAEIYGLEVLERNVQDSKENVTRFLLFGKRYVDLTRGVVGGLPLKASLVFTVNDQAGALYSALEPFARHKVNITKLESRPDRRRGETPVVHDAEALYSLFGKDFISNSSSSSSSLAVAAPHNSDNNNNNNDVKFKAMFFMDVSASDPECREAMRELAQISSYFRVVGLYAAGGPLLGYVAEKLDVPEGTNLVTRYLQAEAQRIANDEEERKTTTKGSSPKRLKGVATNSSSPPPLTTIFTPLRIGIVGFGNFGQFLAKAMVAHGHRVAAASRTDYSQVASEMRVERFFVGDANAMLTDFAPDIVIISTSILSFEDTVRSLDVKKLAGRLVVEVLSVKGFAKSTMLRWWGPDSGVELMCTHPMFGPESGRFSWRNLPFVYERTRLGTTSESIRRGEAFLDIFRRSGCRMMEMSCEEHDAKAANSQFVTHFTGRVLKELNLSTTGIDTKGFASLLGLVENTCKDSDDLFLALYRHNPSAASTLEAFRKAVEHVSARLTGTPSSSQANNNTNSNGGGDAITLSNSVSRIAPSKTNRTHALAMELKDKGRDVVTTLTVGEPHFGPPEEALAAAEKCLRDPKGTKYTAVAGTPALRKAIAMDYAKRKGVTYDPDKEILVSGGGKQSVYQAVHALCGPGDEVVIPSPYWVSYPDICRLAGATPVVVRRDPAKGYIMSPEQLRSALSPRTKMLILCNPCNPTGCLYSERDLLALAAVLADFPRVVVLADEIYERIVYSDAPPHVSFASLRGMFSRTLIVNGVAKGLAMTGMRIGWLCGPTAVVKACEKLQGQISSCASSVSQAAAAAALPLDPRVAGPGEKNLKELERNRDLAFRLINEIPGAVAVKGGGAFYAFVKISPERLPPGTTGEKLCEALIAREKGVALVPGEAFGEDPLACSFRISYAAKEEELVEGVKRIRDGILEMMGGNSR